MICLDALIGRIQARACTIPTETSEADGTFAWNATMLVVVVVVVEGVGGGLRREV